MVNMQYDEDSGQWYNADTGAEWESSWLPFGESPPAPAPPAPPDMGYQNRLDIPINSGLPLVTAWPDANFPGGGENTTGQPGTYGAPASSIGMTFLGPDPSYPATMPGPLGTGTLGTMTEYQRLQQELAVRTEEQRIREHAANVAATKQYNDARLRQYQQELDDRRARGQQPTAAEEAQLQALRNQAEASQRANALAQQELAANTAYRNASLGQQSSQFGQTLAEQQAARAQSAAQFERTFAYQQKKDQMALGQQFLSTMIQEMGRMPSPDLMRAFFQMLTADTPSKTGAVSSSALPTLTTEGPTSLGLVTSPPSSPSGPATLAPVNASPQAPLGATLPSGHYTLAPGLDPTDPRNIATLAQAEARYAAAAGQRPGLARQQPGSSFQAPLASSPYRPAPAATAAPVHPPLASPAPVAVQAPAAAPYRPLTNANYVRNPLTGFLQRA